MTIEQVIASLKKKNSICDILDVAANMHGSVKADKDSLEREIESIREYLLSNQHKKAVAVFAGLLLWDANKTVAKARKKGIFRPSRYAFDGRGVSQLLRTADSLGERCNISEDHRAYLDSVRNLLLLSTEARSLRESLSARLKSRKNRVLKTLFSTLNAVYSMPWIQDRTRSPTTIQHWSAEDLAEAFSTLLEIYRSEIPKSELAWQLPEWKLEAHKDAYYERLLTDAACLSQLREAEAYLDAMPYRAFKSGNGVAFGALDPALEKSIRHGYIQTEIQRRIRVSEVSRMAGIISLDDLIKDLMSAGLGNSIQILDSPLKRLVFAMPGFPEFLSLLKSDDLLLEEAAILSGFCIDTFQVDTDVLVTPTLSALDLIKVQRLFHIINSAFQYSLDKIEDPIERAELRIQSTVMVVKKDDLVRLVGLIIGEDKADDAINFLVLKEDDEFIDILYKPIIECGTYLVISPAVAALANTLRNIVPANQLHDTRDLKNDPMEAAVENALKAAGFLVKRGVKHRFHENCETDLIAWRDDHLFVFECKNPYLPCSAHEMRNTYVHLEKAEHQLDMRYECLKSESFQAVLFDKLGWKCKPTNNVYTGIINANRVFSGYAMGRHPVRQAHELINVLSGGWIGRGPTANPLRFWKSEEFQVDDLVEYLEGRSIISRQLAQLVPEMNTVPIGRYDLKFERFTLNLLEATKAMDAAYAVAPDDGHGEYALPSGDGLPKDVP